jgi:hypothetical protein
MKPFLWLIAVLILWCMIRNVMFEQDVKQFKMLHPEMTMEQCENYIQREVYDR